MNKISQNNALDLITEAMEQTNYIGSLIGSEVNLHSRDQRDHLNFLMTVADLGISEGLKRATDDPPQLSSAQQDKDTLLAFATQMGDIRGSGTTTRIATALALYAMMFPTLVVEAKDTYNKDVAHSCVAEMACMILTTLKVPFRRVDNRSFVVTPEPTKN